MRSTLVALVSLWAISVVAGSRVEAAQGVGTSADLTGTVTDPTGKSVPDAKVTAVDEAKGVQRRTVTDDQGSYRLSGLAPSTYRLTVELSGFQTETVKNVVLTVGRVQVLDFHLKVAGNVLDGRSEFRASRGRN